ncbi:hypothetical protein AGR4C_Cc50362 [Agrobacterium tumefaciens str. Kerr 14]|uniref:Uncharacterized protein n=1 Tax=Agrobacterium tumefaciens str. Kerr 14 TaxID=1183424 RepID=A0A1S7Q2D0_AGRTU|nr:hypothetical protein AGR4C_Cc50362 [Agrobacterium tumefaciens str. Kerr 14]
MNVPDFLMLVRGQNFRGIADCDPSDWHCRARFQPRSQMHGCVDADFRSAPDVRPVEHGSAGRDEHLVVNLGTDYMTVGPDYAVVAHFAIVAARGPDHRVFEHDAVPSDADGAAGLRHQASTMHNPAARTDDNITTDRRILRNPGIGINRW